MLVQMLNELAEYRGLATTGYKSSVILLTALKSCTIWYDPSGFLTGKIGVLNSD